MKILHITSHLGGGVGTVIMDWMEKIKGEQHTVMCLDYINDKAQAKADKIKLCYGWNMSKDPFGFRQFIELADIVLVHYWDHPMLAELLSKPLPDCRMALWVHKKYPLGSWIPTYPDKLIQTSPIQGPYPYIWSTGNMDRFLAIKPKPHEGFNVGYVGTVDYKKLHSNFIPMCLEIIKTISNVRFTVIGENHILDERTIMDNRFTFSGKVDDVAPYLAEMDVFAYPLRPDHYGTCEIALGEAMAAGVVPVVMDNPAERLIVKNNENGVVATSEKDFIYMVKYLYKVEECRRRLSHIAKHDAAYLYSIDNMIVSWNQVFESMMQSPKTKRSPLWD